MDNLIYKYLDKNSNEEEQQTLLSWLKEDENNRKHFIELYRIWNITQYNKEELCIEKEFEKLSLRINHSDNGIKKSNINQNTSLVKFYIAIGVAASLFTAIFIMNKFRNKETDILRFAKQNQTVIASDTETTLILSNNKTITFNQSETSINYENDSIRANSEKSISKRESGLYNQLIVPYGKKSIITFSDGTKLWANAGTRLVYPASFTAEKREIFIDGEVYLDVVPYKSTPFVIRTQTMNIKVLGTRFGITDYNTEDNKRVVLVSGTVEVENNRSKKAVLLQPHQMYEKDNSGENINIVDVRKYTSWIHGTYIFDREPLKDVLSRLSRFYDIEIECDNKSALYLCSGTLDFQTDIEEILNGLTYSIPIRYLKENGRYEVLLKE